MLSKYYLSVAGLAMLMCCMPSQAQQSYDEGDSTSPWSFKLQAGFEREPVYTGSDVYVSEADVGFELTYQALSGHEYFVSLGEVGVVWALDQYRALSTLLEYEFGRDNDEDPALTGFPEVEDTVEAQVIYRQKLGPVVAGIGAQYDIGNKGKGLVGFLGAAYVNDLSDKAKIKTQVDLSFADAEHMATEVGISQETAAVTGYNSYAPDSGYKGLSITTGIEYELTRQWLLRSELSLERYGSIMSDSPLIRSEGSSANYEMAVGVEYRF